MDSYSLGYANIALVKYWGKKSKDPVLPFNPNISLRLDNLLSKTKIEPSLTDEDEFYINDNFISNATYTNSMKEHED